MNKSWKKLLSLLLAGILLFSLSSCKKDEKKPDDKDTNSSEQTGNVETQGAVGSVSHGDMVKKIEEARKVNDKTAAWLSVPGTNIDVPIIHDETKDNEYYLLKNLEGEDTGSDFNSWVDTVVFADFRTSFNEELAFASNNYVLFGHNWNNIKEPLNIGNNPDYSMFAQLPSYTDQAFLEQNPYIYFSTPENEMIWKVYAVFYCEQDWTESIGFNYIEPNLTQVEMSKLATSQKDRSMFITDVEVNSNDRILTLSTCSRVIEGAGDEQRFVVVARQLREGETDQDPITVKPNSSVIAPNL